MLCLQKVFGRERCAEQSVIVHWIDDPRNPGRQVGVVTTPALEYDHPLVHIAVRCN